MLSKQVKIKPAPEAERGASPGAAPEGDAGQEAPKKGKAISEAPKKEEARQEAPKKGEDPLDAPKKGEARQEAPKKGEDPLEAPKKEEARQEAPKKGEASPDTPKKGKVRTESPKEGEASPEAPEETPKEGEDRQEPPKKPVFPFGKIPFQPHHWRLVTFILGICSLLLLMVLLGFIGKYVQVLEATKGKMAVLQGQKGKLKDSVRQQAGGKGNKCDSCLNDWVQRGDACYLFSSQLAKWPECIEHCRRKGAKLVKMDSQGELVFLKRQTRKFFLNQFRNRQYYRYWIGLIYRATLKKRVWWDDSPFTLVLSSLGLGTVNNVNDACVFFTQAKSYVKDCSTKHRCLCKKNK